MFTLIEMNGNETHHLTMVSVTRYCNDNTSDAILYSSTGEYKSIFSNGVQLVPYAQLDIEDFLEQYYSLTNINDYIVLYDGSELTGSLSELKYFVRGLLHSSTDINFKIIHKKTGIEIYSHDFWI